MRTLGIRTGGLRPFSGGKSVYVTNQYSSTISQYDIGAGGPLTAKTPATVFAGGALEIAIGPDAPHPVPDFQQSPRTANVNDSNFVIDGGLIKTM